MSNMIKRLTRIKNQIEEAKTKKAHAEGRLSILMKELKDDHGCKDTVAAERKLKVMNKKVATLKTELEEGIEALEEAYDWG